MATEPCTQSAVDNIDLVDVVRALADPVRVHIVVRLADDAYHPCKTEEYGFDIHKSTLSYHFKTLREAGIRSTRMPGRSHGVQIGGADPEARFPGVLGAALAAAADRSLATGYLVPSEPARTL